MWKGINSCVIFTNPGFKLNIEKQSAKTFKVV